MRSLITTPGRESDKLYDIIAVPESRTIARDTLLSGFAKIDFSKSHVPLLFIGGESDNIFPAAFSKRIAGSYKHKGSTVDFRSFAGRSHFICGESGWEEVAGFVSGWLNK